MDNFKFIKAATLPEAFDGIMQSEEAKLIGGGTNLIDLLRYRVSHADTLVDINHLPEFHEIQELPNGGLRLGALATNADTAYHPVVEKKYPLLSRAILAAASAQIRNMATNGGNLMQRTRCYYFYDIHTPCNKRNPGSGCSAIGGYNRIMAILGSSDRCIAVFPSDMCVALSALDAVVNVRSGVGERTIPFEDFHRLPGDTPWLDNNLQPGEMIVSIDLPPAGFDKNYSYLKLRDRNSYAFALVSVATGFEIEDGIIREARIALGGVAHKPWRNRKAEEYLIGKVPVAENFRAAAQMILQEAVGYKYNDFKIELARKAIERNCLMALHPEESQKPGAQPD